MSAQQPAQSLTDAAALLSNILASAETIRTLSNVATTGPQTTVGAASGNTLDGQLSSLFPSRGGQRPITAPLVGRDCAPRYQAQHCFGTWTSGSRRKSLQLVMSCGNKLVTPNIQEGQELNGMLIHKIFKTKALYLRPSRTLLADSEEEKYLSTAAGSTDKDSDEDHCVIPAVTRSCVTTRAALRNTDPYPSSNNGEGIPGTGSDDADTNDPATSGRKRRRESQGVDGSPGTSSQTTGWLARDGNPGTSGYDYSSYLNLVSTLSQESSDDEEFNKAIIASMECQIAEKVPTKEILLELSSKINSNRQCKFNINRSAVWEGATRGFQRLSYDPTSIIYVKFSDDMGRQEEGIDLGGPRREYLRLLMETIARSPMFEGKENCKSLALDSTALREDRYYLAGRAIAVSLVHGGPPPNFLSPTIFSLLVKGSANPALEEIADPELLNKVRKVSESTTAEELEESKAPLLDYLANAGCLRPVHSDSDRELLVKDIVMFQVVHRVQGPFQRFCEGMKTLGVLDAVRKHPDSFKPLFCYEEHLLSADQMDNLFIIQLSPEGSNKRTAEERVVTYWRDYLQDAEEEEGPTKVQKILAFATGASVVPPIGFSPTPSVEFIHNGEDDFASTPLFPIANTCVNCIRLPLHVSYGVFKDKFDFALGNTYGFGRS
ncbi:hypothetical protein F7725_017110 [Dissostichus mawsoni]|uniref:HECT-type E3 ubiquitin transferase n=1 Tax=Dissostichus mawsoni TaxID=36200 RepID=A0A7J5XHW8_DISMA|nr:hypothetical protein F7725_028356 [Dissostichus mawsoni]KAF3854164.1 hypothetical protein F7725_022219 [Dissostichus mawsoni]KAF3854239.1 hypothetical protein F7725_022294 [Dissostichus mawsoni]KAF3854280.1 hypothetical protein F7725_022335 [Dissostichus mawsoni]KAF3856387.1 hypothetical protein F7725_017110 [Dissostichus mawsoni]